MGFLKIGEKDREGRQKRIEHTGRHLRASRTGGVSLRAQTRVSGVNVTANTRHGVRVSTRVAKNTQVALQNGRFVLRGRYGSDAARINLSKSGVTVSSKTPVGALNWVKPGRSSFKMGGIHVRGKKAVWLHAVYLVFAAVLSLFRLLGSVVQVAGRGVRRVAERRQAAAHERERLDLAPAEVASEGERIIARQGVDLSREPLRDLLAALAFTVVCLGRGESRLDPVSIGMAAPGDAWSCAFAADVRGCGERVAAWLADSSGEPSPQSHVGLAHALAVAFARRTDAAARAEALLSLDDACLAAGPKTLLQEEMIDILALALEVDLILEGEA